MKLDRSRKPGVASLAMAMLLLALTARPALADHTEKERATDDTAYTMQGGTLRVGVFKLQYSPVDFAMLGTYTLPWAVLAATVHGKVRVIQADPIAIAGQIGFAYFDSSRLTWLDQSAGDAVVTVLPMEGFFSYRFGKALTLSASVVYTEVGVSGGIAVGAFEGAAEGATDNLQLTSTAEIRLSETFAIVVHGRWLVAQRVLGRTDSSLRPDAFTRVEVHGDVAASDFQVGDAFSTVPSLHMSWGVFNLRLGLGYGNYNLPLVNFVLPQKTPIPDFDLFFVF